MRNAHVLGLGAVDQIAQDPAAVATVGVHGLLAEVAAEAGGDAGDDDLLADLELRDGRAHLIDDPDALVPENAPVGHGGQVALENVQVGPADRRGGDADDRVRRLLDRRPRLALPGVLAGTVVDERFHLEGRIRLGLPAGGGFVG